MKLISLTANQPGFRPIYFNETGISLVSARRQNTSSNMTYNSVGKSLSIYLIHFCLGANVTSSFREALLDWEFTLVFRHVDEVHTCSRNVANVNKIVYDGNEMRVTDFTKVMGEMVFRLNDELPSALSFRSLLCHFIRKGEDGYVHFDRYVKGEQEDVALLGTGYLLGLNPMLIQKKIEQKKASDVLKSQSDNLEKDPVLESIFLGSTSRSDLDIKIVELDQLQKKLQVDIRDFVVAEDYGDIKQEADRISAELTRLRNDLTRCNIALENIRKSTNMRPDISKQALVAFFESANVELAEAVVKRLEEVENFHANLLDDRERVLQSQKSQYEQRRNATLIRIEQLSKEENEKLQYLHSHGALDEYTKLNELLSKTTSQLESLMNYKQMAAKYKVRREMLRQEIAQDNVNASAYLEEISEHIRGLLSTFMHLVHRFYPEKTAGLTITNNDGQNKQRFKIDARISDDSGDGVNKNKLFCFDWTMLLAQCNHDVQFLVHDSRIISDTDPRQIAELLRIADEYSRVNGFQYILTINDSSIDLVREELGEDFDRIVTANEVLQLNDLSDEGKLLGMQIDLQYE